MGRLGARGMIAALALAGVGYALLGCGDSPTSEEEVPSVSAPAAPAAFYGIAAQAPLADEELARMAEGGVGTLRAFFAWQALDPSPTPDDYDWASTDAAVGAAAAHGVEVFPYLFSTPEWVAKLDDPDCDPESDCPITAPRGVQALAAWRDFVGAAVDRYGPEGEFWNEHPEVEGAPIRRWQIWNEQNSPSAYAPAPDTEGYAQLLESAAAEIRSRDPEAEIVLGGMFGTPFHGDPPALTAADFLDQLYSMPGLRDSFDGVAAHPYAGKVERVEGQVEAIESAVERAGDDAELFITEIGWSSGDGGSPLERGPSGQAESLADAYELFLNRREEWNLVNVTWYSWRDYTGAEICEWCAESGLFEEAELTPKPAWEAFAALPRS